VILVTGATGKVGRHLVADLLAEGAQVRALTRDPESARLAGSAEIIHFDPDRPEQLAPALAGVSAMFVNVAAVGRLATDLMAAALQAGVRSAVMLSSFTVSDGATQAYSIGTQHKRIEDVVEASGLAWTILRCGGFAANTLAWAPSIRQEGVVRAPYGDAATALIAEWDVAAAAAAVLLSDGPSDARYILTGGESLTQVEQVDTIGAAIGRTLRFEELSPAAYRQTAAPYLPEAAIEDRLRYLADCVGRTAEMSPDFEKLTGRPATNFADWATEHASSFR